MSSMTTCILSPKYKQSVCLLVICLQSFSYCAVTKVCSIETTPGNMGHCSSNLAEVMSTVCDGEYNSVYKRDILRISNVDRSSFVKRSTAFSYLRSLSEWPWGDSRLAFNNGEQGIAYKFFLPATMSKLAYGVPRRHVLQSKGGDSDIMKFYCTTNQTTYGQKFSKFQPRQGKHTGTGYLSNFRPGVYYSQRLDELDNPVMGHMIADNYQSLTHKQFRPYEGATGKEPLPNSTKQPGSGFVRQVPLTVPTMDEVRSVAIDTRAATAPSDYRPQAKPHLHKILAKDPVELENGGYGPAYMTTETSQKFQGRQPDKSMNEGKCVGFKEGSGFTHAKNTEPISFHPEYAHQNDLPAYYTDRPTDVSIMKTHFRPTQFSKGNEPLPVIATRSDRDTGFTTGTKALPVFVNRVMSDAYDKASDMPPARVEKMRKADPTEYLNATNPNNFSSVNTANYLGKQRPDPSEADRLGRTSIGFKESTGFTENNDRFVQTDDNPARFITHYTARYMDRTPKGIDREGHTWGGVQPQKRDGFTRSTQVHDHGPQNNSTATLRNLEPYVSRSIKTRDVFFDDHTYDAKMNSLGQRSVTAVF